MKSVCDTKVLYDTQFEAEIACARHSDNMKTYRCPGTGHYHITHLERAKRKGVGFGFSLCADCKVVYKSNKQHTCAASAATV